MEHIKKYKCILVLTEHINSHTVQQSLNKINNKNICINYITNYVIKARN
jgi:hypothetical protein